MLFKLTRSVKEPVCKALLSLRSLRSFALKCFFQVNAFSNPGRAAQDRVQLHDWCSMV